MEGEFHYIERDLDGHEWYLELVADFVEIVERYAAAVAELEELGEQV